jgi:hypothetical protein
MILFYVRVESKQGLASVWWWGLSSETDRFWGNVDYRGRIWIEADDPNTAIEAVVRVVGEELSVSSRTESLGSWRLGDIHIERRGDRDFALTVEGDRLVFRPGGRDEASSFARELGIASGLAGKIRASTADIPVSGSPEGSHPCDDGPDDCFGPVTERDGRFLCAHHYVHSRADDGGPSPPLIAPVSRRRCPYCAETIRAEAVVCRYCGREVGVGTTRRQQQELVGQAARRAGLSPYYVEVFETFAEASGSFQRSWNWAAFLFGFFWYFSKGIWLKPILILLVAAVLAPFTLGLTAIIAWVYFGIAGNWDYYLKLHGSQLW